MKEQEIRPEEEDFEYIGGKLWKYDSSVRFPKNRTSKDIARVLFEPKHGYLTPTHGKIPSKVSIVDLNDFVIVLHSGSDRQEGKLEILALFGRIGYVPQVNNDTFVDLRDLEN